MSEYKGPCKDCAKWTPWANYETEVGSCSRRPNMTQGVTWPNATCPAWEKRRDKLDERAEEMWRKIHDKPFWSKGAEAMEAIREVLAGWAAEDKEAGK